MMVKCPNCKQLVAGKTYFFPATNLVLNNKVKGKWDDVLVWGHYVKHKCLKATLKEIERQELRNEVNKQWGDEE